MILSSEFNEEVAKVLAQALCTLSMSTCDFVVSGGSNIS